MCSHDNKNDDDDSNNNNNLVNKKKQESKKKDKIVVVTRERRQKRDRVGTCIINNDTTSSIYKTIKTTKPKQSRSHQKHSNDDPSGGIEALIPSLIGLIVLGFIIMGMMGFRGRATTAGIDLGTTNSVICIQAPSKGIGNITCIPDANGSPIIPSVVSFLGDKSDRKANRKKEKASKSQLTQHKDFFPPTSHVVVGHLAKNRIESHPHQTIYHAKRLLGRSYQDPAVVAMQKEVEFEMSDNEDEEYDTVQIDIKHDNSVVVSPSQIGAYVVHYMMDLAANHLGHGNVQSAVICVPAKFNAQQRAETAMAFRQAGVKVSRIIEEPTAAALAYGLHKKEGVEYILVYDFGGGTLDVSLLHVTEGFADVMGIDGDELLGGADFDAGIAHFLADKFSVDVDTASLKTLRNDEGNIIPESELEEQLLKNCPKLSTTPLCTLSSLHTISENLKIQLSSSNPVSASCFVAPKEVQNKNIKLFCSALQNIPLELTLKDFDTVIAPSLYRRSILPIQRLLKELALSAEDIDEVVMVGGTTRMPQIRQLVKEELRIEELNTHIDPDLTVAYGAASIID